MPKVEIDYSNTIIYKIACNDPNITDVYVGHTTNFVQRKHAHKQVCNNINSPCYNLNLYKTIRKNGNWSNWEMSIVNFYNCKYQYEARQKEQEHYVLLGATLNTVEPFKLKKHNNKKVLETKCVENNNKVLETKCVEDNIKKVLNKYECDICQVKCFKKSHYIDHMNTKKHKNREEMMKIIEKNNNVPPKSVEIPLFSNLTCICGNTYKYMSGLSRHKKICPELQPKETKKEKDNEISDKELMLTILKENSELKTMILDVCKTIATSSNITNNNNNVTNNSINNSNNKTFNIQVYLNEECKDALNLSDFVSSIQLQLHDLEETGRLGYVDGVSQIITTKLNDLDATKRPIQCSDVKRETLYIKEENKWFKEDEKKEKIKNAIKQITRKNIHQIPNWINANPGCTDPDSKYNDTYLQIVFNAMSGDSTEEQLSNVNKIVSKVSKGTAIDK